MNLELIPDSDPRLHTKVEASNPREWEELGELIPAMFKLMHEHDGMGLAAPQVGVMRRMFIMVDGTTEYVVINPKVIRIKRRKKKIDSEGCLS